MAICALSGLVLLLAIWIVVPAPTRMLLNLAVPAPEVSPWILTLAIVLGTMAALDVERQRAARVALACCIAAAALGTSVLARAGSVARRADADLDAALGRGFLGKVPETVRHGMRTSPLVVADLFRGIPTGAARITRGIPARSAADTPLTMDVYQPTADGSYPGIVQIYGGAWQRGSPGENAVAARYFAARGYVVFAIDYRHAPQWRWPAQIDDVRAALRWIHDNGAQYGADPSRLALWGRSAGGHLAMLAAFMPGGTPVRAVVSYYGPTDLIRSYRELPRPDPLDVRSVLETFIGGTPGDRPDAYRDGSPLTYATRQLPPTLQVQGLQDHIVMPRFPMSLHDRLRATGTVSVLLEIPAADHAFDAVPFGPSAQLALYYTERFLAWAMN
jgi:acetyl esterase/lipase